MLYPIIITVSSHERNSENYHDHLPSNLRDGFPMNSHLDPFNVTTLPIKSNKTMEIIRETYSWRLFFQHLWKKSWHSKSAQRLYVKQKMDDFTFFFFCPLCRYLDLDYVASAVRTRKWSILNGQRNARQILGDRQPILCCVLKINRVFFFSLLRLGFA